MMSTLANIGVGVVSIVLDDFIAWQQRRARDAAWKPSEQDKADYLAEIASDTPEKIQEEVAGEQGKTWADRQPPDSPG